MQQARWVHGRGDKGVGRYLAHGMRENRRQTGRMHGTHRAGAIPLDINPFLLMYYHIITSCGRHFSGNERKVMIFSYFYVKRVLIVRTAS